MHITYMTLYGHGQCSLILGLYPKYRNIIVLSFSAWAFLNFQARHTWELTSRKEHSIFHSLHILQTSSSCNVEQWREQWRTMEKEARNIT